MSNEIKKIKIDPRKNTTKDRPIKSIFKTITWRIIASATTFALAMIFFRDDPRATEKATGIAIIESILKIVLYFLHERAWEQIRWGRMMLIIRRGSRRTLSPFKKKTEN